jgi:TonB family protein
MKQISGKKIGQSGYELTLAVFFSFFIHAAIVVAALFLHMALIPRVYVPPFYNVKLVALPAEHAPAPTGEQMGGPPKAEPAPKMTKPQPKQKKSAPKPAKSALKKGTHPGISYQKLKPTQPEQAKPETEASLEPPSVPGAAPTKAGGRTEGVAVPQSSEDFKFPPYLGVIRDKIEQNWNPPPGVKGTKATVLFRILRSGRVGDAKLQASSGNFYFDQAAVRAILQSSPFPQMPDGFFKEYEDFSVDLMEKE